MKRTRSTLLGALLVWTAGCTTLSQGSPTDPGMAKDPIGDGSAGSAPRTPRANDNSAPPSKMEARADASSATEQGGDAAAGGKAFKIPLEQSVAVGAFVLQLHEANVMPAENAMQAGSTVVAAFATVSIDFDAHNEATSVKTPLADLDDEDIMLEAGGKFFYGKVDAQPVPGLRDGIGSVSWKIFDLLDAATLRGATITLGAPEQNKVVIPLSDPSRIVTLADLPIAGGFKILGYLSTTFDFTGMSVLYNSHSSNVPLKTGTAVLVLQGVMSADSDFDHFSVYWGEENMFLERPDGVSVAPEWLNENLEAGGRKDLTLTFDLTQPVAGTYTFGMTARDLPTVTQQIVVQ